MPLQSTSLIIVSSRLLVPSLERISPFIIILGSMNNQVVSTPMQVAEPRFLAHQMCDIDEDEGDVAKIASAASSSGQSPSSIMFAVDRLSGVFRVPDDAIERASNQEEADHQEEQEMVGNGSCGSKHCRRFLSPSFTATDGELSTFSEDTEEGADDEGESSGSDSISSLRFFPARRRQPTATLSIFRPSVSGIKRSSSDIEEEDEGEEERSSKRCCSAPPPICHANPICSDSDQEEGGSTSCDEEILRSPSSLPSVSSAQSLFAGNYSSPFGQSISISPIEPSSTSPFTSLFFAEAMPATTIVTNNARGAGASITPNHLQHPLSFQDMTSMKATNVVADEDVLNQGMIEYEDDEEN